MVDILTGNHGQFAVDSVAQDFKLALGLVLILNLLTMGLAAPDPVKKLKIANMLNRAQV